MASRTSERVLERVLGLGDDALVASQRLGEWIARAPTIEEDVALGNIALDLLGQARTLLSYAGELEAAGRDEDALAYFRDAADFRNAQLVERPNGDFAVTMVRLLLFSAYQVELYAAMARDPDPTLSAIAAKAVKEVRYHRDHATQWVLRLGDGTEESHARIQKALEAEWPYLGQLFTGATVSLRPAVEIYVGGVLSQATLQIPSSDQVIVTRAEHTPALVELLGELQQVARAHPGATW